MVQVKVFFDGMIYPTGSGKTMFAENAVNDFLATLDESQIIDIQFSCLKEDLPYGSTHILVVYKDLDEKW